MEEYPIKEDCFAFDKKRCECMALNDTYCKRGICSFYKTAVQHKKEKRKYPFDLYYGDKSADKDKIETAPADYISTSEATKLAGISEYKVHRLIYNGTFMAMKEG